MLKSNFTLQPTNLLCVFRQHGLEPSSEIPDDYEAPEDSVYGEEADSLLIELTSPSADSATFSPEEGAYTTPPSPYR